MYSSLIYKNWHAVVIDIRLTDPIFDRIWRWCNEHFGPTKTRQPHHTWNWGTNAGYSTYFVFKNKDDFTLFVLTWSDDVKII